MEPPPDWVDVMERLATNSGLAYEAFVKKYQTVSFDTIREALQEKGGWDTIAMQPDWGFFKFGHTYPNQSNSGLATLVLMAYSFHNKSQGLALKDILDKGFQDWLAGLEGSVTRMSHSTGDMMHDMVVYGPSTYNALFVSVSGFGLLCST